MSTTKPFIIAEMSCNHLGDYNRAVDIVNAAHRAGADAVKLQCWQPDSMCLDDSYQIQSGPWAGRLLTDLYREAYTPLEWFEPLFALIRKLGMVPLASPFDRESVDFLETLGCPIYKIASFEITDLPLIRYVASKGQSMIISTGMATWPEILDVFAATRSNDVTWLKCTSAYPAQLSDANLRSMFDLRESFGSVGLSDHTMGHEVAVAATLLGAEIIEKHLTLSRADGGPDAGFSMEPDEFAQMVLACRNAAALFGIVRFAPTESEASNVALRRSLYIAQNVKAGDVLTVDNLRTARPAAGLAPKHMPELLGRKVKYSMPKGTPLDWSMVDEG